MNNQKKMRSLAKRVFFSLVMLALCAVPASAGGLADSTLGTGLKNLLTDASNLLLVLCPAAGGTFGVYFFIRRSMSDEQDGKMWEKRIKIAIGCGVGGCLVAGLISVLSTYF